MYIYIMLWIFSACAISWLWLRSHLFVQHERAKEIRNPPIIPSKRQWQGRPVRKKQRWRHVQTHFWELDEKW